MVGIRCYVRFWILSFAHLNLFRISNLVLRIWLRLSEAKPRQVNQVNQRLKNEISHFEPQWLCGPESIMQNKPNVKMGNMNISTATVKAYAKEQRTKNNERYPKQTQSKPISVSAARFTVYKWRIVPEGPIHRFAARESRIQRRDTNLAQPPPGSHNMKKMCLMT